MSPGREKKNEILKAAAQIFGHYGYEKATLDDIGKQIGLNKASLYYYYENKESLFEDVISSEIEEFTSAVQQKISTIGGCKKKVATYIYELLRYSSNTVNVNNLSAESIGSIKPVFKKLSEALMEKQAIMIKNILVEGMKQKEVIPCDVQKVAHGIVSVAWAIKSKNCQFSDCFTRSNPRLRETADEIVFTVSLIMDGLTVRNETLRKDRSSKKKSL